MVTPLLPVRARRLPLIHYPLDPAAAAPRLAHPPVPLAPLFSVCQSAPVCNRDVIIFADKRYRMPFDDIQSTKRENDKDLAARLKAFILHLRKQDPQFATQDAMNDAMSKGLFATAAKVRHERRKKMLDTTDDIESSSIHTGTDWCATCVVVWVNFVAGGTEGVNLQFCTRISKIE